MKKYLFFSIFILFVISIIACKKTDTLMIENTKTLISDRALIDEGVIINSNVPNERGLAGPGVWSPSRVYFNTCYQPNGICYYLPSFGGGPLPIWEAKFVSNDVIRLNYLFDNSNAAGPGTEIIIDDVLIGISLSSEQNQALLDFMNTHFNVPHRIPVAELENKLLVEKAGLPSGTQLFLEPGEYEIIKNDENPLGYIDVSFSAE